jgi:putative PIN family toxin of toxin-antitoxin system
MVKPVIVLDTNVFVAASFNPESSSARILEQVKRGQTRMVWNEQIRQEIQYILQKIPHLCWEQVSDLFKQEDYYMGEIPLEKFNLIADPDDRKFIALSEATGAVLITMDHDLLSIRNKVPVSILTPGEFLSTQTQSTR